MEKKNTIFFFCYRLNEFKNFVNSKVLENCSKKLKVVLIVPKVTFEEYKKNKKLLNFDKNVDLYPLNFFSKTERKNLKANFFDKISNLLRIIFSLTYAKKKQYKDCLSQKFQMKAYFNSQKSRSIINMIISKIIIGIAKIASKYYYFRVLLQKVILFSFKTNSHKELYCKYSPSLVVVGSMGLDVDANIIYEAKKNKVKTLVINQSWDRTVCKGYPTIHPDYLIVWNNHMKDESFFYLDMPKDQIFVEGAPTWDYLFNKDKLLNKKEFIQGLSLDPSKPLIYYPLSSEFWHDELIENIKEICKAKKSGKLNRNLQFILRVHPYYWRDAKLRKVLFKELKIAEQIKGIFVNYNEIIGHRDSYFLNPNDKYFLLNCFHHCDVCLSVTSSSMMEMIFCGKPAINFLYGKWELPGETIRVIDYKLHHLEHLYSYNIINHVYDINDLFNKLSKLKELKLSKKDCEKMIDGEIPINRGNASLAYAERIHKLSNKTVN